MRQCAWVIGAGGLLGSALVRALRRDGDAHVHEVRQPLAWGRSEVLREQFRAEVALFARQARQVERWSLIWAAGVGAMSSDAASLQAEAQALDMLLTAVDCERTLQALPGALVLASSAGAIYAQSRDELVSEASAVEPSTAYAVHKLSLEARLSQVINGHRNWSALIARYSTLYGLGQARDKPQGLISQLARRIVANEVIHIYVPLDTIRDYLFADDAAARTQAAVRDLYARPGQTVLKIIAAEQSTSIAQLVGLFKRVSRRPVRLVTSVNGLSPLYQRCLRFCSTEPLGQPHLTARRLEVGIHQVLEAERLAAFGPKRSPD